MKQSILRPNQLITTSIFRQLLASYEEKWQMNPMQRNRLRSVVTARQCLSFILKQRFELGSSQIGALLGQDHATQIYASRNVSDMIDIRNENYLREIVKWSEVFDEILPDNALSESIVIERVRMVLDSSVIDGKVSKKILEKLIEEY